MSRTSIKVLAAVAVLALGSLGATSAAAEPSSTPLTLEQIEALPPFSESPIAASCLGYGASGGKQWLTPNVVWISFSAHISCPGQYVTATAHLASFGENIVGAPSAGVGNAESIGYFASAQLLGPCFEVTGYVTAGASLYKVPNQRIC